MVRNYNEIKREKVRMVINYKALNKEIIYDGFFFLHNKESMNNKIKDVEWFSKFNCKSRYWQLKMDQNFI